MIMVVGEGKPRATSNKRSCRKEMEREEDDPYTRISKPSHSETVLCLNPQKRRGDENGEPRETGTKEGKQTNKQRK